MLVEVPSLLQNKLLVLTLLVGHVLPEFSSQKTSNQKKASELIEEVVKYEELLNATYSKLHELLHSADDDFEELFEKVLPHLETFERIRNQTEFYESIIDIKIPDDEDSKTFPTFSLAELMIISADLVIIQAQYLTAALKAETKWKVMIDEVYECRKRLRYFQQDAFYEPLASLQIYFEMFEIDDLSRQNKPKPAKNMTTEEIISTVTTKLLPLVRQFEETKIEDNEPPYFETKDISNLRHMMFLKDLMDHLQIYDPHYETLLSQWVVKVEAMTLIISDDSDITHADTKKWRLEDIAMGIQNELPHLVDRIKKLSILVGIRSYNDIEEDDDQAGAPDRDEL